MDENLDFQIATHIVRIHQKRERAIEAPYTAKELYNYIRLARSLRPRLSEVSLMG